MLQQPQTIWRWKIAVYFFLEGLGAGSFVAGIVAGWTGLSDVKPFATVLGVVLVVLSAPFLILDLGRPERFFRVFANPFNSWLSRGALLLNTFIAVALVYLILLFRAPAGEPLRTVVEVVALILGLATATYTGILVGVNGSRPFWHSPLMPLLFLASALWTGLGAIGLAATATGLFGNRALSVASLESLTRALVAVTLVEALLIVIYLAQARERACASVDLLLRGQLARQFWIGVISIGLAASLVLQLASLVSDGMTRDLAIVIAGIALLAGGLLLRLLVLAAGIRPPMRIKLAFNVRPGA